MPAFGLDLGSSSFKLMALSGSEKQPKLEAFGLAVNPVGNLETDNQQEKIAMAQAVKKLIGDSGIKERKVAVALPESKVFTRVVEMPILSESELASAINWEAEQYIPIPISEVQLDYRVLSEPKAITQESKMRVFLVAAPVQLVNKVMSFVELVGLEAEAVETEVLSVSRALSRDVNQPPHLIVNLAASTTDLCIIESGNVVFTRSIPTGGNALTRGLASELGLEFVQAEQYKRSYGLDGNQLQGKVRGALMKVFSSISAEAHKAVNFYTTSRQGKIARVLLSGGGAYLPEVTTEFARELGVEVVVGNPLAGLVMDPKQQQRIGGIGAVFTVATGLGLRGL